MDYKKFLDDLRNKPEQEKKKIVISIISVISVIFAVCWIVWSYKVVKNFDGNRLRNQINSGQNINL